MDGVEKSWEKKKNIDIWKRSNNPLYRFQFAFCTQLDRAFFQSFIFFFSFKRHSSSILMFDLKKAEKSRLETKRSFSFDSQHCPLQLSFLHTLETSSLSPFFPTIFLQTFFCSFFFLSWILPHSRGVRFTGRQFSLNWYRLVTLRLRYLLFRSSESPCTPSPLSHSSPSYGYLFNAPVLYPIFLRDLSLTRL